MDYKELIKSLTCQGAEDEPDNLGCSNKKCKYRDVDGACDLVSMDADAAVAITELLERAEKAERERDAAVRDLRERAIESCSECNDCLYRTARSFCTDCSDGSNWKWRGVQEE